MVVHARTVTATSPKARRSNVGWTGWELSVTTAGRIPRDLTLS